MSSYRNNCRWCRFGSIPNEKGEHWIVKSIMPAKIDIRKCTAIDEARAALAPRPPEGKGE